MQLLKLNNTQRNIIKYKVKPLLTNDLSFNIQLINSLLDIEYKKYDDATILNYIKTNFNNSNKYNSLHLFNLNGKQMYTRVDINENLVIHLTHFVSANYINNIIIFVLI